MFSAIRTPFSSLQCSLKKKLLNPNTGPRSFRLASGASIKGYWGLGCLGTLVVELFCVFDVDFGRNPKEERTPLAEF